MRTILVVDDEAAIRQTLEQLLTYEQYAVQLAANGAAALAILADKRIDVMLLDIKMADMDGFEVLERMTDAGFEVPVIVVSGHGNVETAVEAVRKGAYDFLEKPLDRSRLLLTLQNCLDHFGLRGQTEDLRDRSGYNKPLIGECARIREVRDFIDSVAPTAATVLITGENGTGKELVVRALHAGSPRRDMPLVEVNCAAIPRELVESELFGHEKGSFTGADKMRVGKFEQADGGTLFLDEIGDMSEEAQAKVLKAVEESRFERVGGREARQVDVRIVAATNRDLTGPAANFRQDLYFRLNVLSVELPPLRERGGDVSLLLEHFMSAMAVQLKKKPKTFTAETLALLRTYAWPGNVRELRNLVERLMILVPGDLIRPKDLPVLSGSGPETRAGEWDWMSCTDFQEFKARSESMYLQAKLRENRFNVSRTAEQLGMQRSNLYKKISKYGLQTQAGE
ncbi:sigma-54 dependent transcriptional regulator [bacterium]|nr:sigma-54 dependent transcriptional regulator [bacterium]MBU1674205.1 sigma-54 dependent transcriptional regulator [bacterium]